MHSRGLHLQLAWPLLGEVGQTPQPRSGAGHGSCRRGTDQLWGEIPLSSGDQVLVAFEPRLDQPIAMRLLQGHE